jgi:hypothetical protein
MITAVIIISISSTLTISVLGQRNTPNTKSPMIYHGGRVIAGAANLYFIWYGCWTNSCGNNGSADTRALIENFGLNIGSTPYFMINTGYPNDFGQTPSASVLFGGIAYDPFYSRGTELTDDDIRAIVVDKINSNQLPADPAGMYIRCRIRPMSARPPPDFVLRLERLRCTAMVFHGPAGRTSAL